MKEKEKSVASWLYLQKLNLSFYFEVNVYSLPSAYLYTRFLCTVSLSLSLSIFWRARRSLPALGLLMSITTQHHNMHSCKSFASFHCHFSASRWATCWTGVWVVHSLSLSTIIRERWWRLLGCRRAERSMLCVCAMQFLFACNLTALPSCLLSSSSAVPSSSTSPSSVPRHAFLSAPCASSLQ